MPPPGEGGKLRGSGRLLRGRDYELVPERLWKFLSQVTRKLHRPEMRLFFLSWSISVVGNN